MSKLVLALVTAPTHINNVLMQPGEVAEVDLAALGVKELGDKTPGLVPHKGPMPEPAPPAEVPSSEGRPAPLPEPEDKSTKPTKG